MLNEEMKTELLDPTSLGPFLTKKTKTFLCCPFDLKTLQSGNMVNSVHDSVQ